MLIWTEIYKVPCAEQSGCLQHAGINGNYGQKGVVKDGAEYHAFRYLTMLESLVWFLR